MTKEEFANLPVGATFTLGNVTLKVTDTKNNDWQFCTNCFIADLNLEYDGCIDFVKLGVIPECLKKHRKDNKNVAFVEES